MKLPIKKRIRKRHAALLKKRQVYDPTVEAICDQLHPYGYVRMHASNHRDDEGVSRDGGERINPVPEESLDTLVSGLGSTITNPTSTWQHLGVADTTESEPVEVSRWLDDAQAVVQSMLLQSNYYIAMANHTYPDVGSHGTSAKLMYEQNGGVWFRPLLWGQYVIAANAHGIVDTLIYEDDYTAAELVDEFGEDAVSDKVRNDIANGNLDTPRRVMCAIMPTEHYRRGAIGSEGNPTAGFPFTAYWFDCTDTREDAFLRVGGYYEFPGIITRWRTVGREVYGRGPGHRVLGTCRALQHAEDRLESTQDKADDPPLGVTGDLQDPLSLMPGAVTVIDPRGGMAKAEPLHVPEAMALSVGEQRVARFENHVRRGLFVHLFLDLINDQRAERATATEIEFRHREALLQMGGVLLRFDADELEPVVMRTFLTAERLGRIPPRPDAMLNRPLKVVFDSVLHRMQRAQILNAMRAFLGDVLAMAQTFPEALEKINIDAWVDEVAEITGIKASLIRSAEEVEELRRRKAERQQAMEAAQAGLMATEGARNLGAAGFQPQDISQVARQFPQAAAAAGFANLPALQ